MRENFQNIDGKKLEIVHEIKSAYDEGKLSLEEARKALKDRVQHLAPYEIAIIEQEMVEETEDECVKEDIQAMLEVFQDVLVTKEQSLPENHPISCYRRENAKMKELLLSVEDLVQYPVIKNQWLELYEELLKFKIHLSRKQNQLYPVLEKKGFTRPTTTMWTLDDFIRDEIAECYNLLLEDKEEEFIGKQAELVADVRDLMDKEENILYPTSLEMISDEEFRYMAEGDQEIGFAYITVDKDKTDIPKSFASSAASSPLSGLSSAPGFAEELAGLLGKYGFNNNEEKLNVTTGQLTLEQINLIYQHMPVDLSYVDENELVCFYTDTKHRVFPRSKNVIGRDVKNCHPKASVHIVEEIIKKFRSGEQDKAEFWINKPDLFIYIVYFAVRDENGKFRGVLEMMQDCTHIRSLQGSQTLLTWEQQEKGEGTRTSEEEGNKESTGTSKAEENNESTGTLEAEGNRENIGASEAEGNKENAGTLEDKGHRESTGTLEAGKLTEITEDTMLKDILEADPNVKTLLFRLSDRFKALNTPLARIMMPKATVKIMSERAEVDLDTLLRELREYFKL
ncbi:PAS domain-containing protein [Oribacterium sp.]